MVRKHCSLLEIETTQGYTKNRCAIMTIPKQMAVNPKAAQVEITFDEKIKAYMAKKGYVGIVVDMVDAKTCCSGYAEIVATLASQKQLDALQGKVRRHFQADGIQVAVLAPVEIDDAVQFKLARFLGIPTVSVKGMRAFTL